jgi:pullulanase
MRNWKFNHIDFSQYPAYRGEDLGVFWSPEKTTVKIWAPTAKIVELRLYKNGSGGEDFHKTNLQKSDCGTWTTVLNGDYDGKFYTLRINDGDWMEEVPDIYARCVGVNGLRGMIYNPGTTNPDNWHKDKGPRYSSFTEAVIYETHVRDFSIATNSGIKNKGTFLAFTETNTKSQEGLKTGLDHLKELGITHVHLMPVNDFVTIDEEHPHDKYNWGYDPQHYNALEGSFSSDPHNGKIRISEFKQLVKSLHDNGIGVILDVVLNHTYYAKESVFNQTIPGYFYRQKEDGTFSNASGCGNEIASEREMVRKYILDTLKYWVTEYHVDGFRFDLMGILDMKTMQDIRKEMNNIDSGIFLYGEGWAADYSPMPEKDRAVKQNTPYLTGIAGFNDDFRDVLKGNNGDKKSKGFVSGLTMREEIVKLGIVGAVNHPQVNFDYIDSLQNAWVKEPDQCINYAWCHDNYTLWDKLKLSLPKASDEELRKRVKLTAAMILLSQGVPLLSCGADFCRTKKGDGNSYKSPDVINEIDWSRKNDYIDVFEYIRQLIQLRKNHPAFRMKNAETIYNSLNFYGEYMPGVVSFCIKGELVGDNWSNIFVIFNGNNNMVQFPLPFKNGKIVVNNNVIDENGITETETTVTVEPISAKVIAQTEKA